MAKTDVRPTQVQMLLMEHLLQSAMRQLNEIRLVVGLTVDTSHEDLMNTLQGMVRGGQTVPVEISQQVGMQGGHTLRSTGTPESSDPHD
jgi:hypothetical protein